MSAPPRGVSVLRSAGGALAAFLALAALAVAVAAFFDRRFALAILVVAAVVGPLLFMYARSVIAGADLHGAIADLAAASGVEPQAGPAATIVAGTARLSAGAAELRGRADQLAAALAAFPDPILVLDASGRATLANPALEALAGVRPLGRSLDELFPASELPAIHGAASAGESVVDQIILRRAQGPRTWEVTAQSLAQAVPGPRPPEPHILMTFRDVTEAARVLRVRTDFVANASHELRTPIAAIRMALETLGSLGEADAGLRERLTSMMTGQLLRLEELARDLLDLSRLEAEIEVRREAVPVSELVAAMHPRFEGICAQRHLTLGFEFAPELDRMVTDRRLLELILGNLIENATKFAFEGTTIRVVGRPASVEGGVLLEVIDRGVGIPLDQQQRIFERFYQVDPSRSGQRRGSGLGLAIVKHAARRLGGTVSVKSVWQQGTTISVELPGVLPAG